MPRGALYLLFTASGFAGLIYESIWTNYLKLFLGHAAYAQTVVLIVFIGGMAIGAWLCGHFAHRMRNPLLGYAVAEFLIGVAGLVFHRVFVASTDWAYATLLPATCSAEGWCVSSWLLAALVILPQSILLGTTFPLMTAGILRIVRANHGKNIALLYFLNSFGAVFGVLASAFVLIPSVGLPGTTTAAGVLNVLLALIVYLIARTPGLPTAVLQAPVAAADSGRAPSAPALLLWIAALTGLSSFIYEIVWIRMLSLVLGSSTYAFELMLASFILGIALGGAWIRNRIDRLKHPRRFLAYVQIAMGLLALATIALYNSTFDVMAWMLGALQRTDSGYVLFNVGSSLIAMAIMLPPTFMAGMTLPLLTFLLLRDGYGERSIGYVYAWNTIGSIGGVIVAVHFGLPAMGIRLTLVGASAVDIALGLMILAKTRDFRWPTPAGAAIATCLVAFVAGAFAFSIDPYRSASGVYRYRQPSLDRNNITIDFERDGKTATIVVQRHKDSRVIIQTNGKPDASIQLDPAKPPGADEYTMVLAALLPLGHNPQIKTAANIGFGSGLTAHVLLASPVLTHLDNIEIEPAMYEGAKHFRPSVERAYTDPRSHMVFDDAKSFFARSRQKYDLIVSEPSNPWVSGVASLFTEEFYERIRSSLNPGGLLVQWIQGYEFTPQLIGSISSAMGSVFKDYVVYGSQSDILFVARLDGNLGPLRDDVFAHESMRREMERLGIRGPMDLATRRIGTKQTLKALLFNEVPPVNSDYLPFVEYEAPRARFRGQEARKVTEMRLGPLPLLDMIERRAWPESGKPSEPTTAANIGAPTSAYNASIAIRRFDSELKHVPTEPAPGLPVPMLASMRAAFVECASVNVVQPLWDDFVDFAAWVNPVLPPAQLDLFWARVEAVPCLHRLPPAYSEWIALFRAAGARDAKSIREHAESLLQSGDPTPRQVEYLLYAAMAGSFVMNDQERMRALADRWMPRIAEPSRRLPWFRTLRAMSGGD